MGIGRAQGEERAKKAAQMAIESPLLDINIDGARRVLFNIVGTNDLSLVEINEAARIITQSVAKDAQIVFGAGFDNTLRKGEIKITVIAGGFEEEKTIRSLPLDIKLPIKEESISEESNNLIKNEESEDNSESILKKFIAQNDLETPAFLRRKKKN
jgi:cell division protein FtsZ